MAKECYRVVKARAKILFVHQRLQPPGGANGVAAWFVEALKEHYSVTILTWDPIRCEDLNRFYGTSLRDGDFLTLYPHWAPRLLRKLDPDEGSLQPAAYLMRYCHAIRHRYDLVIGAAMEEMDLGGPGLLYIHYPLLSRFWARYRDCRGQPLVTKLLWVLQGRTRPWMALADYSVSRLKQHTFLVNSDWTGRQVERIYGVQARTLYPPVPNTGPGLPWQERRNGFITSGRFNPGKRMDWIVSVLSKVRGRRPDLTLHLAGTRELVGDGVEHYRLLRSLAREHAGWVMLHENLSREELSTLTGQVRYGIHAQVNEHFGIAPAETLSGGCVPFVHDSGGQVEIVNGDPRLCFTTAEDAVQKITAVMEDSSLQSELRESLEPRRQMFTAERFVREIRQTVENWLHARADVPDGCGQGHPGRASEVATSRRIARTNASEE